MTIVEPAGLAEFKQRTRATWAAGDFPAVARRTLWEVGQRLVRRVGIGAGEDVLDVACGTGNVAIRAAQAGGRVVGVDLTPELLPTGRQLAEQAGVRIEWIEGDAEALPLGDESFDVVLSTFGVMFAPRHEVAASELVRVLRPGGRLGLCNWTPEGIQGALFRTLGAYLPLRQRVCDGLVGNVIEVGFGSGLNVPFYPSTVTALAAVEPSDSAWKLADKRLRATHVRVQRSALDAQTLPYPGHSFDAAVSSWSLCTIPDAVAALQELRRVLKPGARLHFVEHGLAPDEHVRRWQRRLEPLQKKIFAGCYLTRSVADLLHSTGFIIDELDVLYEKGAPKFAAAYSLGVAVSP